MLRLLRKRLIYKIEYLINKSRLIEWLFCYNSQLINTLQFGLYNIEKDYQDGSTEQNMVLKQGGN